MENVACALIQNQCQIKQPHRVYVVNCGSNIMDVFLACVAATNLTAKACYQTNACGESIGVSWKGNPRNGLDCI